MATYSPFFLNRTFDDLGVPLDGGLFYTYAAGAGNTAQLPSYQDPLGATPFTNPIVLNAGGFPTNGSGNPVPIIWLTAGVSYKFILTDSGGSVIWENDNYTQSAISGFTANLVTDLRNVIGVSNGQAVWVDGVSYVGDGGQGWWYWSSATAASDDLGMFIQPTGYLSLGRWVRFVVDKVNVKWYNAKGDGATDDRLAFLAAVTGANGLSPKLPIYAPPGTYKLTSTPAIDYIPLYMDVGAVLQPVAFKLVCNPVIQPNDHSYHFDVTTGGAGSHIQFHDASSPNATQTSPVEFLPEWFGAKADGTTDDAAAISAAIFTASASLGVYFGNVAVKLNGGNTGKYAIGSGLSFATGVAIKGAGTYTTITQLSDFGDMWADSVAVHDVLMQDLNLTQTTPGGTSHCIAMSNGSYNMTFRNIISNGGIIVLGQPGNNFYSCNFSQPCNYGATSSILSNNTFGSTLTIGSSANGAVVNGNLIAGLTLAATAQNCVITGNKITTFTNNANAGTHNICRDNVPDTVNDNYTQKLTGSLNTGDTNVAYPSGYNQTNIVILSATWILAGGDRIMLPRYYSTAGGFLEVICQAGQIVFHPYDPIAAGGQYELIIAHKNVNWPQ